MRVDIHCHMGQLRRPPAVADRFSFEPAGTYAPYDAYFSDPLAGSLGMRLAAWHFRLPVRAGGDHLDEAIEAVNLRHILGATTIDRAVVLAMDQYHTDDGRPLGPRRRRQRRGTDLYVSNTYVRSLWRRYPRRILFGAAIHPYRRQGSMTAADMLGEVAAAGAVLVKWLPPAQNIDARDPRTVEFLRRAGRLGIPMLIHYGQEWTLHSPHRRFFDPSGLLETLRLLRREGDMPTVIVAHAATPATWPLTSGRTFDTLVAALEGEFADAPLYADTAALTLITKLRWLRRLLRRPGLQAKLVHGSDYPIPPMPGLIRHRLGGQWREIAAMPSWLDREAQTKRVLGVEEAVFHRGGELLAHRIALADRLAGAG